jgi:Flp pilus assembly protein TadD
MRGSEKIYERKASTTVAKQGKVSRELLEEQTKLLKTHLQNGEYLNALEVAEQLLEIEEREAYWITVGYIFTQMREYERSLVAYQNVLRLNPQNDKVWFNIGYSFLVLGDVRQALKAFNKAIVLAPDEEYRKKAEKGREICLKLLKG